MFGNALGWAISAVIVGATIWFLTILGAQGDISPPGPVGENAANWTVRLPVEPGGLAPFMVEPTEPGPLYKEAIALYEADEYELKRSQPKSTQSVGAQRWGKIMELALKAGKSSRPVVFAGNPGDVINYDPDRPKLEALRAVGKMTVHIGLLHGGEGNKDQKRQYMEAAFALGARLYNERLTFGEYMVATELLGDAGQELANLAMESGQAGRAGALRDFDLKRQESYRKQIRPVQEAVMVVEPNPGDIFALADKAPEPMWRVEAVLALGRLRYSAERFADKQGATQVIAILCTAGDPRIRTAAIAARDLTVEQFRKLR